MEATLSIKNVIKHATLVGAALLTVCVVYTLAHASKAIVPKDPGGPFGQRIEVSVQGSLADELVVGAYVTGRVSSSDWYRYSIVVLNWQVLTYDVL